MATLQAEEIMRLTVKVGPSCKVGSVTGGMLQVIPIIGGNVAGAKINGTVIPGGADWNITWKDGIAHVFAKYLLETDDGEFIAIENEGLIDPGTESVIKTKPTFNANNAGRYRDLNYGVYVGELSGTPDVKDNVDIVVYKLK
jgi:hypothetical protein